jgi:hypothetical protein
MASQGPFYGTVFASVAPGDSAWATPASAGASDDAWAIFTVPAFTIGAQSDALRVTDFPFVVAPDATGQGLEVAIERSELGASVYDVEVRLVYQGAVIGENKLAAGEWPTVDAALTYGGALDDWDADISPLIVNDPTFGVQIVVGGDNVGGIAGEAWVDGIRMTYHFALAPPSAATNPKLSDRVREMLRDQDARQGEFSTPEIDNALSDAYLVFRAMQPAHAAHVPSALTIRIGANTFALPTSDDDRESAMEYAGDIRLQRASDGVFLKHRSRVEVERMRTGLADGRRGRPTHFTLWEEADGEVQGLCYPRTDRDEPLNVFSRSLADDPRDFADLDAATFDLNRAQRAAVVYLAAADLAARMAPPALALRRLSVHAPARWRAQAHRIAYDTHAEHAALESVGRTMRGVA